MRRGVGRVDNGDNEYIARLEGEAESLSYQVFVTVLVISVAQP